MRRIRKAKATQRGKTKSQAFPVSWTSRRDWHSVMADAEQFMTQLHRSIELARAGRDKLRAASDESTMRYQRALQKLYSQGNYYALSIWAR